MHMEQMDKHRAANLENKPRLLVIGNGMVGHRFVETAIEKGLAATYEIIVLAEEARPAYDRVNLSKFFEDGSADALGLYDPTEYHRAGVTLALGDPVTAVDTGSRIARTESGRVLDYACLVLATGSRPFVPPIPGSDAEGAFVYRTIEDLESIRRGAEHARVGVVIGGGLLGLEAANALLRLGLETHVVEMAPRLMPLQVDELGGGLLGSRIGALGVAVHTGAVSRELVVADSGRVSAVRLSSGAEIATDLVVFSAGIRPRDELARAAGLAIAERGGVLVDAQCRSSDSRIFAIGECAAPNGRTHGLVAPGYRMAEVAAAVLAGEDARFEGADTSTKLKLLGVEVGSFGDAFAKAAGARIMSAFDGAAETYKKLVISEDKQRLLGGVLVGDTSSYAELVMRMQNGIPLPEHPEDLLFARRVGSKPGGLAPDALPDAALICSCHNVDKQTIRNAIREKNLAHLSAVKSCTKAGTGCGSCAPLVDDLLKAELRRAGVAVKNHLCEHFPHSRQELYHLIRLHDLRTFDDLLARHGQGHGCEICKPAVASILASCWNEHVLEEKHAGLQDTNDRFLANIQRDGTYSVVPRVAAGEITPDQLIALGNVAKKHGLYTKITGAQRVDMFGARVEQLPSIWKDLVAAGFESGHAYGKALRTVKSCVGSTWCRYGVQDSVALALLLENRYKGLRSPHKLKGAVSGCARECAEAQGKDFGVIATDKGFNLYVCGNGGMKPQHAVLLAADIDANTVVRCLDRFLMFYVRTADRLQRTATWLNKLEGGLDYLKSVIIDDSLAIGAELEAEMAHVIATYECEWKKTVNDPQKVKMFRAFVNTEATDPNVVFVSERKQHRPAVWNEKRELVESGRIRLPLLAEPM